MYEMPPKPSWLSEPSPVERLRHWWVTADEQGRVPALLLEWRETPDGWQEGPVCETGNRTRRSADPAERQLAPWTLVRRSRTPRAKVPGVPPDFRFHDLRHYLASLLISSGADVRVVQARMRHASAKTTLVTYGHLWPDSDDSTRAAIEAVMAARADYLRTAAGGDA